MNGVKQKQEKRIGAEWGLAYNDEADVWGTRPYLSLSVNRSNFGASGL